MTTSKHLPCTIALKYFDEGPDQYRFLTADGNKVNVIQIDKIEKTKWNVEPFGDPGHDQNFQGIVTIHEKGPQRALTVQKDKTIQLDRLEDPPSKTQLWFFTIMVQEPIHKPVKGPINSPPRVLVVSIESQGTKLYLAVVDKTKPESDITLESEVQPAWTISWEKPSKEGADN